MDDLPQPPNPTPADPPPFPPPSQPKGPIGNVEPARDGRTRRGGLLAVVVLLLVALVAGGVVFATSRDTAEPGGTRASGGPTSVPSVGPTGPSEPRAVKARADALRVTLSWKSGAGGTTVARYEIARNGDEWQTVSAPRTSVVDEEVAPGRTYRYAVVAVDADGERSRPVKVEATTKDRPVQTAPVQGTFDVGATETSHFGFSDFESGRTSFGWRFDPTCAEGACPTEVKAMGTAGEFRTTLAYAGGTYRGTLRFKGFARCGGTTTTATVTISLRVTKAAVDRGMWRAVAFEGEMTVRTPAQLGCVSSGIDYDLRGRYAG